MSMVAGGFDCGQAHWSTEGIEASHGQTRQGIESCTFDKINLCRRDPVVVPVSDSVMKNHA